MSSELKSSSSPLQIILDEDLNQSALESRIKKYLDDIGCSSIDKICDSYVRINLSESYWYDLGAMLWLISFLNKLKKQRNGIQLILPEPNEGNSKSDNLWSFLIHWRFFDALKECVDDPINLLTPEQIPHLKMPSKYSVGHRVDQDGNKVIAHATQHLEITTIRIDASTASKNTKSDIEVFLANHYPRIVMSALQYLCGWDETEVEMFRDYVLTEGLVNSIDHSEGNFSNICMRIDSKYLTLAISDDGSGIPAILRPALRNSTIHKYLAEKSDADLIKFYTDEQLILDSAIIRLSTQKGSTSKADRKGMGLYYLKSFVLEHGGELRVRSGTARVDFKAHKEETKDSLMNSPGTVLRIQTPLKK